jgi:hypothetical protein
MTAKTCAACDYPLDANAISVKIGGKTVEVCCEECATKVKEAHAAVAAKQEGIRDASR